MILAAARASGVDAIWSEDLNSQQDDGGITVVNPLARVAPDRGGRDPVRTSIRGQAAR